MASEEMGLDLNSESLFIFTNRHFYKSSYKKLTHLLLRPRTRENLISGAHQTQNS